MFDACVGSYGFPGIAIVKASTANFWALRNIYRMSRSVLVKRDGERSKPEVQAMIPKSV